MADTDSSSKDPLDTWLSRLKVILEVVAIPVAAYWAFTRFELADEPSLKIRTEIKSDLVWFDSSDPAECFGKLAFTLKNIGKVNFEIDQVLLRAWITRAQPAKDALTYFSPADLAVGTPLQEKVIVDQLIGEYRPDQSSQEDFAFRFKRQPGMYALIQLSARVKPTKREADPKPVEEYRWDSVCGELGPRQAERPTTPVTK